MSHATIDAGPDLGRIAILEFRALLGSSVLPVMAVLMLTDTAVLLQEPDFARGAAAVPFFVPTGLVTMVCAAWFVPLLWTLARSERDPTDVVRVSDVRVTLVRAMVVWSGIAVATMIPTVIITAWRNDGALFAGRARLLLLFGVPIAAYAPALALLRARALATAETFLCWLLFGLLCVGLFGRGWPIPLDAHLALADGSTNVEKRAIASSFLATLGGIVFSSIVARTLRPRRA